MNAGEAQINREGIVGELDVQINHTTTAVKVLRGDVRWRLMDWQRILEDARNHGGGTTTEERVRVLVNQRCRPA